MGDPISNETWNQIKGELLAGRKIEAIKIYRESTGVQLIDAKQAIDNLEKELRAATPEKFSSPAGGGCFGMILFCLALLLAL